eukprot:jgi/Bigna1/76296/fgenesh1_pg.40_\
MGPFSARGNPQNLGIKPKVSSYEENRRLTFGKPPTVEAENAHRNALSPQCCRPRYPAQVHHTRASSSSSSSSALERPYPSPLLSQGQFSRHGEGQMISARTSPLRKKRWGGSPQIQHSPDMLLEALNHYGVVSALMMNAGLRLYSATPFTGKHILDKIFGVIFMVLVGTSVFSGAYVTVVFTLIDVYSKIALSYGLPESYENFILATSKFRQSGYKSFLLCLISFTVSFGISLVMKAPVWARMFALGLSSFGVIESFRQWQAIISLAEKLIGSSLDSKTPFLSWPDGITD